MSWCAECQFTELSSRPPQAQYLGIRTALGYRNSTPTNVMVAESKITLIRDRTIAQCNENINKDISVCTDFEILKTLTMPWRKCSLLSEVYKNYKN
ncbi:hypothetical protein PUN28_011895 [Cardiocondyla obscurior]|uniref:Uncharacterized protein n=1 Tax=Cardiocondyla obscurior TaxID=286306 RepID=A0AAW2FG94_9HYME